MPGRVPLNENRVDPAPIAWAIAIGAVVCISARLPWRIEAGGQAHLALAQELALALTAAVVAVLALRHRVEITRDRITFLVAAVVAIEFSSALLAQNPTPSDSDINLAMSGNICRCGTYQRIRRAIHRASTLGAHP